MQNTASKSEMGEEEAKDYLQSLLCKNLRVTTTDSRMFWGSFKCTDAESNIILQHTYEYRHPSPSSIAQAAATSTATSSQPSNPKENTASTETGTGTGSGTVKLDMTSRYLGLVVVPGHHIVKIEVEEFASQVKKDRKNKGITINDLDPDSNDNSSSSSASSSNNQALLQEGIA